MTQAYPTPALAPSSGRNPHVPDTFPWRKQTTATMHQDDVAALPIEDQWRLGRLLDIASESTPRWIIAKSPDTLRSSLKFKTEAQVARFFVTLHNKHLLYALANDKWMPAPLLCPHEADFPAVPDEQQSLENLATHTLDSLAAEEELKLAMDDRTRAAVSRKWKEYQAAVVAAGQPLPDERDKSAYEAAKRAFYVPFVTLYRAGTRPEDALQEMLTRLERDIEARARAESSPHVTAEIVTFAPPPGFVTFAPETALETQSDKTEAESHNNSVSESGSARDVTTMEGEAQENAEMSQRKIVTSENVTFPSSAPDAPTDGERVPTDGEESAVVVALMAEEGALVPDGSRVKFSRYVATELIADMLAQGKTWAQMREIVGRQAACLRFRNKNGQGEWAGMWRNSIVGDWTAPDAYRKWAREQTRQAKQETDRREQTTRRAEQEAQERDVAQAVQARWEQMTPEEQQAVGAEAGARLDPFWRGKWRECQSGSREMSGLLRDALDIQVDALVRERAQLPPRPHKSGKAPARYPSLTVRDKEGDAEEEAKHADAA